MNEITDTINNLGTQYIDYLYWTVYFDILALGTLVLLVAGVGYGIYRLEKR